MLINGFFQEVQRMQPPLASLAPVAINASDIINTENGDKIKMSWNVNHIYNIQNSINIGTASIEIKFTFLDSFIQEFGVKREMIDSIDCQVVYQDIKAIDRYLIFDV